MNKDDIREKVQKKVNDVDRQMPKPDEQIKEVTKKLKESVETRAQEGDKKRCAIN